MLFFFLFLFFFKFSINLACSQRQNTVVLRVYSRIIIIFDGASIHRRLGGCFSSPSSFFFFLSFFLSFLLSFFLSFSLSLWFSFLFLSSSSTTCAHFNQSKLQLIKKKKHNSNLGQCLFLWQHYYCRKPITSLWVKTAKCQLSSSFWTQAND